jgi:hypothetical protein
VSLLLACVSSLCVCRKAYVANDQLMDFLEDIIAKAPDLPPEGEPEAPKPKRQRWAGLSLVQWLWQESGGVAQSAGFGGRMACRQRGSLRHQNPSAKGEQGLLWSNGCLCVSRERLILCVVMGGGQSFGCTVTAKN